jgi:hypothetical protein
MGSVAANRFWRTVSPMTATLAARLTSSWLKLEPWATGQSRTVKYCGSVPVMRVFQFWFSYTTWALDPAPGAAAATAGHSRRMAFISS